MFGALDNFVGLVHISTLTWNGNVKIINVELVCKLFKDDHKS